MPKAEEKILDTKKCKNTQFFVIITKTMFMGSSPGTFTLEFENNNKVNFLSPTLLQTSS